VAQIHEELQQRGAVVQQLEEHRPPLGLADAVVRRSVEGAGAAVVFVTRQLLEAVSANSSDACSLRFHHAMRMLGRDHMVAVALDAHARAAHPWIGALGALNPDGIVDMSEPGHSIEALCARLRGLGCLGTT
jgi:hypothetical protein